MTTPSKTPISDELEVHGSRYYKHSRWHKKVFKQMRSMERALDVAVEALNGAITTIHSWHGDVAWDIYAAHSPEMKRITDALARIEAAGLKEGK